MIAKIKNLFLNFSVVFFIAGITSFTAYNWKEMNNFQKLSIPFLLIILGLILYYFLKKETYKKLALLFSCFMIGTLFAVFGQIYQTGADTWILFRNWAIFLIVPTIFSMSYSIFMLLIIVTFLMTFFGLGLYYNDTYSFFIATFIPATVISIYPIIIEKFKFRFNNLFYNCLVVIFYILFNIAGIFLISHNTKFFYYENTTTFLDSFLVFFYPLITVLIFFVASKKYKKPVILPFTIVTIGLIIWGFFVEKIMFYASFNLTEYLTVFFLISLIIFITTFAALIKSFPTIESKFITKLFGGLASFLKFSVFISGLGLLFAIVSLNNSSEYSFLFLGILIIAFSCYLPKILKYKEDNLDLISFLIGLSSLINFLSIIFENHIKLAHLALFAIIIFDTFYFIRKNRVMDLLFAPFHYIFVLILIDEFNLLFNDFYININLLSVIAILILSLQPIFSEKIESSKYKDRLNRVFYGNNMSFLLFFMTYYILEHDIIYAMYNDGKNIILNSYIYIVKIRAAVIIISSIYIIYLWFRNKELTNDSQSISLNNKTLGNKNTMKKLIILIALIIIILCFSWNIVGINFTILLILLYFYRGNKFTIYFLNISLCCQIFNYYYQLHGISLLHKSYYMLSMGLALLLAYLTIKFFIKEGETNE